MPNFEADDTDPNFTTGISGTSVHPASSNAPVSLYNPMVSGGSRPADSVTSSSSGASSPEATSSSSNAGSASDTISGSTSSDTMSGASGSPPHVVDRLTGQKIQLPVTRAELRERQIDLAKTGDYSGRIDGLWGQKTKKATERFQERWNQEHPTDQITVDGLIGIGPPGIAETGDRLRSEAIAKTTRPSAYGETAALPSLVEQAAKAAGTNVTSGAGQTGVAVRSAVPTGDAAAVPLATDTPLVSATARAKDTTAGVPVSPSGDWTPVAGQDITPAAGAESPVAAAKRAADAAAAAAGEGQAALTAARTKAATPTKVDHAAEVRKILAPYTGERGTKEGRRGPGKTTAAEPYIFTPHTAGGKLSPGIAQVISSQLPASAPAPMGVDPYAEGAMPAGLDNLRSMTGTMGDLASIHPPGATAAPVAASPAPAPPATPAPTLSLLDQARQALGAYVPPSEAKMDPADRVPGSPLGIPERIAPDFPHTPTPPQSAPATPAAKTLQLLGVGQPEGSGIPADASTPTITAADRAAALAARPAETGYTGEGQPYPTGPEGQGAGVPWATDAVKKPAAPAGLSEADQKIYTTVFDDVSKGMAKMPPEAHGIMLDHLRALGESADEVLKVPDGPQRTAAWNAQLDRLRQAGVIDDKKFNEMHGKHDNASLRKASMLNDVVEKMQGGAAPAAGAAMPPIPSGAQGALQQARAIHLADGADPQMDMAFEGIDDGSPLNPKAADPNGQKFWFSPRSEKWSDEPGYYTEDQIGKFMEGRALDQSMRPKGMNDMMEPPTGADLAKEYIDKQLQNWDGGKSKPIPMSDAAPGNRRLAFAPEQPGDRSGGEGRVRYDLKSPALHMYPGTPDLGEALKDQKGIDKIIHTPTQLHGVVGAAEANPGSARARSASAKFAPHETLVGRSASDQARKMVVASADGGPLPSRPLQQARDVGRAMGFRPNIWGESEDPMIDRAIDMPAVPAYHTYPEEFYGDRRGGRFTG